MGLHDALHECLSQPGLQGSNALHGRGQLTVVACQHYPTHSPHGNPAGSLQGLGSLIYKQGAKLLSIQQSIGRPHQCAGNDPCLTKQLTVDANLQFGGTTLQALQLLMVTLVTSPAVAAQFADGLAQCPQLRIVGMGLKATLVGKRQHLVVHTCGIAYS